MKNPMRPLLLCLLGYIAVGCSADTGAMDAREEVRTAVDLPCAATVTTDALVYSNVVVSEITTDASGIELSFRKEGERWIGTARTAEGELGYPRPVHDLVLDFPNAQLSFELRGHEEDEPEYFTGHISCDSIWGTWTPYPGVSVQGSMPRVEQGHN